MYEIEFRVILEKDCSHLLNLLCTHIYVDWIKMDDVSIYLYILGIKLNQNSICKIKKTVTTILKQWILHHSDSIGVLYKF